MKTIKVPRQQLVDEILRESQAGFSDHLGKYVVAYKPDSDKPAQLDWQQPQYQGWNKIAADAFADHNGNSFTWGEDGADDQDAARDFIDANLLDIVTTFDGNGESESFRVEYV